MPEYTYPASRVQLDLGLVVKELQQQAERLLQDLELQHDKLISGGMTDKQATAVVLDEVIAGEGVFKAWENSQKKRIRHLEKSLVAKPITTFAQDNPNQKFAWVLSTTVKEHCSDCLMLSGQEPRTISEWRKFGHGLPRETLTICNAGCRCMMVAEE